MESNNLPIGTGHAFSEISLADVQTTLAFTEQNFYGMADIPGYLAGRGTDENAAYMFARLHSPRIESAKAAEYRNIITRIARDERPRIWRPGFFAEYYSVRRTFQFWWALCKIYAERLQVPWGTGPPPKHVDEQDIDQLCRINWFFLQPGGKGTFHERLFVRRFLFGSLNSFMDAAFTPEKVFWKLWDAQGLGSRAYSLAPSVKEVGLAAGVHFTIDIVATLLKQDSPKVPPPEQGQTAKATGGKQKAQHSPSPRPEKCSAVKSGKSITKKSKPVQRPEKCSTVKSGKIIKKKSKPVQCPESRVILKFRDWNRHNVDESASVSSSRSNIPRPMSGITLKFRNWNLYNVDEVAPMAST